MRSATNNAWQPLASGTFNEVSVATHPEVTDVNPEGIYWIRKKPKTQTRIIPTKLCNAKRAADVWAKINPDLAVRINSDGTWDAPYIAGTTPTDEEVAKTIVDIYKRTRYLMVEGYKREKFIKRPDGTIVCIGMSLALHREEAISNCYRKTDVLQNGKLTESYRDHFTIYYSIGMPLTVAVILNLLYVEVYLKAEQVRDEDITYNRILCITDRRLHHLGLRAIPRDNTKSLEEHKENNTQEKSLDKSSASTVKSKSLSTAHHIFLTLHQRAKTSGINVLFSATKLENKISQSLPKIVEHAQQNTRWLGYNVRTTNLMQRLGWLNDKKEVITGSGLDKALCTETTSDLENIKFESPLKKTI